ncbi:ABC transporter ATP-binding protein [Thermodesulfobacteriota bacterium B35]
MTGSSEVPWAIRGLAFAYGSRPVLRGIDLRLDAGRSYGILGPNGSGKTTLLDLLCGLLVPDRGTILLKGRSVARWQGRDRARMLALVPQDFVIRFGFTVREVVEMGRHPHLHRFATLGVDDHRLVDRVMEELGIADLAGRPVTRLSGGEKQRVAVARALVQQPHTLFLDEATSNLDVYHSLAILAVIRRRVREQGLTVVAAIHDLNLAACFCDELIFLHKGKVFCRGATDEVMEAEVIDRVYGVRSQVRADDFSGCRQVSFRLEAGGKRSQVPHLRTVAPGRIVGYSGQERPHEPAAPETAYKNEVDIS